MLNATAPTLEGFKEWFLKAGMPFKPPFRDPVYWTANASTFIWYRCAPWQVELYIVTPGRDPVPVHNHPGVDQIEYYIAGSFALTTEDHSFDKIRPFLDTPRPDGLHRLFGQTLAVPGGKDHGGEFPGGAVFYSFQKWPAGMEPTSVSHHWVGDPVDPEHAKRLAKASS